MQIFSIQSAVVSKLSTNSLQSSIGFVECNLGVETWSSHYMVASTTSEEMIQFPEVTCTLFKLILPSACPADLNRSCRFAGKRAEVSVSAMDLLLQEERAIFSGKATIEVFMFLYKGKASPFI